MKLTAKAPENGWLEYDPFLLGVYLFSRVMLVSGRLGSRNFFKKNLWILVVTVTRRGAVASQVMSDL